MHISPLFIRYLDYLVLWRLQRLNFAFLPVHCCCLLSSINLHLPNTKFYVNSTILEQCCAPRYVEYRGGPIRASWWQNYRLIILTLDRFIFDLFFEELRMCKVSVFITNRICNSRKVILPLIRWCNLSWPWRIFVFFFALKSSKSVLKNSLFQQYSFFEINPKLVTFPNMLVLS